MAIGSRHSRRAFTLTEILIVVAVIVLLLALAMPAFNFITGGRSEDSAMNQISAMLARARTEAEGVQEPRGIMFYFDPVSQRDMMCIVKATDPIPTLDSQDRSLDLGTNVTSFINYYYLDLASDDHLPLPRGISVQTFMMNPTVTAASLKSQEQFMGYNVLSNSGVKSIPIGGVIMFDAYGRLENIPYAFRMKLNGVSTSMGLLLDSTGTMVDAIQKPTSDPNFEVRSSLGLAVFDKETADSVCGDNIDPDGQANELSTEEPWINSNATLVTINHYNGTLIKSD